MTTETLSSARDNTSSLFEKLTPRLRQIIDEAIVQRTPPTYQGIYEEHDLPAYDISFAAFYRYARRLRTAANTSRLAELTIPDDENAEKLLPRFVCQQMIEILMSGEPTPRDIE